VAAASAAAAVVVTKKDFNRLLLKKKVLHRVQDFFYVERQTKEVQKCCSLAYLVEKMPAIKIINEYTITQGIPASPLPFPFIKTYTPLTASTAHCCSR
jgi:hypothetical protein